MSDLLPETLWVFAKEHTDRDGYPTTTRGWECDAIHAEWYEERGMSLKEYRRADLPHPQASARIAELEAENARLLSEMKGGSFYQEKDIDRMQDRIVELEAALRDIIEAWDWWLVDQYDRCQSVPGDAIDKARAALGADMENKDV